MGSNFRFKRGDGLMIPKEFMPGFMAFSTLVAGGKHEGYIRNSGREIVYRTSNPYSSPNKAQTAVKNEYKKFIANGSNS